jgi:hypothetical protein
MLKQAPSVLSRLPARLTLLFILAIMIQLMIAAAVWYAFGSLEQRGQFGDMFGVANALFSGLALAGVVYTISIQLREQARARQEAERVAQAQAERDRVLSELLAAQAAQLAIVQAALSEMQAQAMALRAALTPPNSEGPVRQAG